MFDFELTGPSATPCSVNDEGYATLSFHNIQYCVGFGHSGYGSMIKVDCQLATSEICGTVRGEKFFNRIDMEVR